MLQRGYIILLVGTALVISGIIISVLWVEFFAGAFLRENTILDGVLIRPTTSVNASIQVIDISRPVSLAIQVEHNNGAPSTTSGGREGVGQQIPNNTLRETVRNPNGVIMTTNEFTKELFTTFRPDVTGKYTITLYNVGNSPVSIGVFLGNLPFIGANNQINVNSLIGIIVGHFLILAGISILIAGAIVLALDKQRTSRKTQTTYPVPNTTTTAETIVLASWVDRFIAWLIDFIIVSIGLGILFAVISIPLYIAFSHWFDRSTIMNILPPHFNLNAPWYSYIISSIVFMAYWTYFDLTTGQSIVRDYCT